MLDSPPPHFRRRRTLGFLPLFMAGLLAVGVLTAGHARAAAGFTAGGKLPGLGGGRIWGLAADPGMAQRFLAATDAGVYTSSNGGATWTLTLRGVRAWTVGFDMRAPQDAFAGTAGEGVFASRDGGLTWASASAGLPSTDVRSFGFGLDGIAAGTDAGVAESPDGRVWHGVGLSGYSIAAVAVAANSPSFTLVAGVDNGNVAAGSLFQTSGSGWQAVQSGLPASMVVSCLAAGPIDQAVPKHPLVVCTSKGVYRSGDGGTTWSSSVGITDSVTITTAAFDPLDPSVVYAGADAAGSTGGTFMRSTDSGMTFTSDTAGLPAAKNVETIALAPTNPLTVMVAIDPPSGGGLIYTETDTTLGPPPKLVPESPGATVPTILATPTPMPTPAKLPSGPAQTPLPPSGLQRFTSAAFHWPTPLIYEIMAVLLAAYILIRWRQRYYAEGPP